VGQTHFPRGLAQALLGAGHGALAMASGLTVRAPVVRHRGGGSTSMEGSAVTHFAEKGGAGLTEVGRQWRRVRRQQGRRHQGALDGESGGSYIG
jgi:hypothetical protein